MGGLKPKAVIMALSIILVLSLNHHIVHPTYEKLLFYILKGTLHFNINLDSNVSLYELLNVKNWLFLAILTVSIFELFGKLSTIFERAENDTIR